MDDREIKAEGLLRADAIGTLNSGKRRKLLEAALADQRDFSTPAQEKALREMLGDLVFRGRVVARLRGLDARAPFGNLRKIWIWLRQPAVIGSVMALATVLLRSFPDGRSPRAAPLPGTPPTGHDLQPKGRDSRLQPSGSVGRGWIPQAGEGYQRIARLSGRYSVAPLVFPPRVDPLSAAAFCGQPPAVWRE